MRAAPGLLALLALLCHCSTPSARLSPQIGLQGSVVRPRTGGGGRVGGPRRRALAMAQPEATPWFVPRINRGSGDPMEPYWALCNVLEMAVDALWK